MVFSAFCSLSIYCCKACLKSAVQVIAWSKTCPWLLLPTWSLNHEPSDKLSSLFLLSAMKLTGSRMDWILMRVVHLWIDFIVECLWKGLMYSNSKIVHGPLDCQQYCGISTRYTLINYGTHLEGNCSVNLIYEDFWHWRLGRLLTKLK